MRFIRKGGRVIPIRDKNEAETHRNKNVASTAAQGAAGVAFLAANAEASIHGHRYNAMSRVFKMDPAQRAASMAKSARAFHRSAFVARSALALGAAAMSYGAYHAFKAQKLQPDSTRPVLDRVKEVGKIAGAGILGAGAAYAGLNALLKGGMKFRPYANKLNEAVKFMRAKKVVAGKPIMGLLK